MSDEILVISDELEGFKQPKWSVSDTLRTGGYTIESFPYDIPNLVDTAVNAEPGLMVLDVQTPNTKSEAICRVLHEDARLGNVPIIWITEWEATGAAVATIFEGNQRHEARITSPADLLEEVGRELQPPESARTAANQIADRLEKALDGSALYDIELPGIGSGSRAEDHFAATRRLHELQNSMRQAAEAVLPSVFAETTADSGGELLLEEAKEVLSVLLDEQIASKVTKGLEHRLPQSLLEELDTPTEEELAEDADFVASIITPLWIQLLRRGVDLVDPLPLDEALLPDPALHNDALATHIDEFLHSCETVGVTPNGVRAITTQFAESTHSERGITLTLGIDLIHEQERWSARALNG